MGNPGLTPDSVALMVIQSSLDSWNKIVAGGKHMGFELAQRSAINEVAESMADFNTNYKDTGLFGVYAVVKTTEQNKSLCPPWNLCNYIADVALQADHSKLAFFALEFLARWIARGENARPPVLLSVDEGLVVSAFGTAGRTYNSTLLDAAWSILRRSLRQKRAPNPETYLSKIYSHASLGQLQRAFSTLSEFENAYGNSGEVEE
ncbi:LuxS/MPP-like metallohydrolase protein [Dioscorea alata]|uniref:LuxS/MPP-like metallohydrolase protein n=1 Tax=Dioscorea alata TaxID=55571 RepID=A0ACB7TWG5_DIOAL|nr:LuxS/MPP-like metallohydrolase protein [Dioscorea alata]